MLVQKLSMLVQKLSILHRKLCWTDYLSLKMAEPVEVIIVQDIVDIEISL